MKKIFCILLSFLVLFLIILLGYIFTHKKIKYVFLVVGDGMNSNHVELTEIYNNSINQKDFEKQEKLSFSEFPTIGLRKNYDQNSYIPDSASSATALSSGFLTKNGMLNMDEKKNKSTPITFLLKDQRKMKIGIVTTVPITHATPAAFYAHNMSRSNQYEIARDLVDSNFDYFGDGGFDLPDQELSDIVQRLQQKKYNIVNSKEEIEALKKTDEKIIALNPYAFFGTSAYAMESDEEQLQLKDFVRKGIEVLENKNGFFMMIESGMIDYASHNNDARAVISEVNVLDQSVKEILKFYQKHPKETLILVTGDHETGGLSLGSEKKFALNLKKLQYQKMTFSSLSYYINNTYQNPNFEKVLQYLKNQFGIGTSFHLSKEEKMKLKTAYEKKDTSGLIRIIQRKIDNETNISWTTNHHTASPIVVYAKGVSSQEFAGVYTSVQFNQKLRKILEV